jgi:hypothetical protein
MGCLTYRPVIHILNVGTAVIFEQERLGFSSASKSLLQKRNLRRG